MHTVDRDELKALIDSKGNYILIDVREEWEVDRYGSIPTAANIPLQQLPAALAMSEDERAERFGAAFGKRDKVIFYCRSGARSARAAAFARQEGFDARNYPGSVLDWADIDVNVKKY